MYMSALDGAIEMGRFLDADNYITDDEAGAHVYGWNGVSIGICMIGTNRFTKRQFKKCKELVNNYLERFELASAVVRM